MGLGFTLLGLDYDCGCGMFGFVSGLCFLGWWIGVCLLMFLLVRYCLWAWRVWLASGLGCLVSGMLLLEASV